MAEQSLWHRLALSRDRLCCSRFLGSFSPEARAAEPQMAEDPRPYLHTQRFAPGANLEPESAIDWREVLGMQLG